MSKNENQDLVDLCELNSIDENIKGKGLKEDQDEMQKAIDWKKRQVMSRIRYKLPPVDQSVEDVHHERNFEIEDE